MKIALQMDALTRLNLTSDSTLELARAAAELGFPLFHYEPATLRMTLTDGTVRISASGHTLHHQPHENAAWRLGAAATHDLHDFDVILMRQDPPFDLGYIAATHMLEHVQPRTRVINDPAGVRNAPEKLLMTYFAHLLPPTLVTRDVEAIMAFRAQYQDIVIKPLFGYAGHGIFHLRADDDNLASLVETLAAASTEPWMIQKFLRVGELGDKRIIMLNGNPVGSFKRMPMAGDSRGNMRVGASAVAAPLTARDREICAELKPALIARGLFLAGLDVIGDYLTEINVTSPTGLVTADRLEGRSGQDRIAAQFWQAVAR